MGGTVRILGVVRHVTADGNETELRSAGQRRLLSAIAVAGGGTVRADALCESLDLTYSALRTSMSRLRARLGEAVIETDGSGYRLNATVDATEFEALAGRVGTPSERLAHLDQALALWDGDAFEEFNDEPWAQTQAVRLGELRLVAIEDRAELLIATRRGGEAVAALEAHVAQNPYRDRPRGLLVQALASAGRQADALRAYQTYRSFLAEETGTEPSAAVQAIEQRVAIGTSNEHEEALARAQASGLVTETSATADNAGEAADISTPASTSATGAENQLPSGLVTFLFTDIEASTRRWENAADDMRISLAQHYAILHETVDAHHGMVFKNTGDGIGAAFTLPAHGVECAVAIQRELQQAEWLNDDRLKVRIGLHVGDAAPTSGDYFGLPLNRAARLMDIANGDQIVVSDALASFLDFEHFELRPMGEHVLRGIGTDSITMVVGDGLVVDDRDLRARVAGGKKLPTQAHRLIGRDREVKEVVDLLDQHRAVTLVGPGGVGKTRISVAIGDAATAKFTHGVVMCELADLSDGDAVTDAVAEALGARAQPGMSLADSIVDFLEDRQMLLILDNCEHVSEAVRDLGHKILSANDSCILATSREPIGLPAEQMFGLNPLEPTTYGVELFLERAHERDYSFAPTPADLDHITRICSRLDGIPLGIELAAAWVRVLSPEQLVERLQDRFQVLRGGRSGGRHQTLRDTVLWSYEQLDEMQATLFNRLSVFAGGFSLDAVETVCADDDLIEANDVLNLLMALVDKSMVVSVRGVGHIRFALLGTLRQFGQEQLDASTESELYRQRHGDYFVELAATGAALLISDSEAEIWGLLDREWSNFRAAFDSLSLSGNVESVADLVLELGWFATLSMRFELFAWADELFAKIDVDAHEHAAPLYGLRALSSYFTVAPAAAGYAHHGLSIDGNDPYGYCRVALAAISLNNELSPTESETQTSEWLASLTPESSLVNRMWALGMRTFHLCAHDPSPEATDHAAELMEIATTTGSATASSVAHWAGGMVATFGGIEEGLVHWHDGIDSAESLHPVHLVRDLIVGLVLHFTVGRGDLAEAIEGSLDALTRANENHYNAGTSHLFGVTAIVLCRAGQAETAATLLHAMTANGHLPRSNAVRAVERSLGNGAATPPPDQPKLSINEAAAIAMNALRDALAATAPPGSAL